MSIKYDKYMPLYTYLSPASIPQIVAHIQDYLVKHPILSVETIAEIIVQSLQEHPELINGTAIPISADSEQSIKAYIDSLPSIDTYTKAEINTLLTGKQDTLTFDQAPTPGSSNPVTSSGIIAAMSAMNEALETLIEAKADSVSTYTKTQVDTLLTDKANAADVYSKNTMDAKLLEYATSDSVYSKQDINTMKQVNKANLAIVSTDGLAPLDIAAGQYVYFNDVMYMATEEILTGVQLVPNANIVINPIGVTNRIGDGLKNAVTQINGLAETVSNQSQQIENLNGSKQLAVTDYNLVTDTGLFLAAPVDTNVLNAPDPSVPGRWYNLSVWKTTDNVITQIANSTTSGTLFVRWKNSGGWSEWLNVMLKSGSSPVKITDYLLDDSLIGHIYGLSAFDPTLPLESFIQVVIDNLDMKTRYCTLEIMTEGAGRGLLTGYLYNTKAYGAGLFVKYGGQLFYWQVSNNTLSIKTVSMT